jgi:iron complex outermembrane receptor protein
VLVTSGSIGNPDLQAERSFSYEAGADFFIKKELKISSSVFRREQRRLIDWVTTTYSAMPRKDNLSPAGTYALASNIAKVNTTGFETDVQFTKTIGKVHRVFASVGILWLDSKSSSGSTSFYVSSHAKFMSNISFAYNNRWFGISANGIYKYRQSQAAPAINATISRDYFLMNVKAEGYLMKKRLSVFVEADNLFDKKYSDLLGAVMPGFWMMGGVRFELGIRN